MRMKKNFIIEILLNNGTTELIMSSEFAKKKKFRKKKLDRPIYVRNVDGTLNYKEPIKHTVEVELFFLKGIKRECR